MNYQYYQRQYDDLILQSKVVAGDMAREYQINRVIFLNNAYNNGGRDELVTNNIGNQIIYWQMKILNSPIFIPKFIPTPKTLTSVKITLHRNGTKKTFPIF